MTSLPPAALLAALLAYAAPARAHLPHDTIRAVAVPADLDPAGTWVVLSYGHVPLLHRAGARGYYEMFAAPPVGDQPFLGGQLGDGTVVLVGATALWWSADLETWQRGALPGTVTTLAVHEGQLVLGGPGGAWAGPADALARVYDGAVIRMSSGGRLAVLDADGVPWVLDEGGWTALPAVEGALALLASADEAWLGTRDGAVLRWDGEGWTACGTLPTAGAEHGDVVALAVDPLDPGALYVGTGLGAPHYSADGCATFEDRQSSTDIVYDAEGSPTDETLAVTALLAHGGAVLVATWKGVFQSTDGGLSWTEYPVLPADYLRGLAVVEGEAGQPVVYLGPYAAGPMRTEDEGATWTARNAALLDENVQHVAADAFNPDLVYAVVGHGGAFSRDGGATWARTEPTGLGQFDPDEQVPDEVWGHGSGQVLRSTNGGVTWGPVEGLPTEGRFIAHLRPEGGAECVVTTNPSEAWCDEGAGWQRVATLDSAITAATTAGADLLLGASEGVHRVDEDGVAVVLGPLDADRLLSLITTEDGTVFAGTQGGLVYRSQDGGAAWEALPVRFAGTTWNLAPLPGFPSRGEVLVGTLDGSYVLRDAGGPAEAVTAERWAPIQKVDDASGFHTRGVCSAPVQEDGYDLDTWSAIVPGCTLRTVLRGERLRILGTSDGDSEVEVWVDGALRLTLGGALISTPRVLATVEVEPGWHELVLVGVRGEGLRLDGFEARVDAASEDTGPADSGDGGAADGGAGDGGAPGDGGAGGGDDRRCGCTTGAAGSGAWALLLVLAARRRRR